MPRTKAVITDYIGTLVSIRDYQMQTSRKKLFEFLTEVGFQLNLEEFLYAYKRSHEKYQRIRYEEFLEITNSVWISEALNSLGCQTDTEDPRLKTAINLFFHEYLCHLELRPHTKQLLERISGKFKLGLISNFTYSPVIYASLQKLGINQFFNAILISHDIGYRKPHQKIFLDALRKLQVDPKEAIYLGDSPLEDIKGARAVGMKTVFVPSQFYSSMDLRESKQETDFVVKDLGDFLSDLPKILVE